MGMAGGADGGVGGASGLSSGGWIVSGGMGHIAFPHPTQTNLHATRLLPSASRPLAAGHLEQWLR